MLKLFLRKMRNYKISKGEAIDLQKWALNISGAKKLLDSISEISNETKDGLCVDYTINESELDGGMDWPDIGVVSIYGIIRKKKIFLGEIRAYNQETFWLSTREYDEVDNIQNWFELINEDYKKRSGS